MTTLKPRRVQSHTIDGATTELDLAASSNYLEWPSDIVQRPTQKSVRQRADKIFQKYLRYRTPESWAPGDYIKLAKLSAETAYHERETFLISERRGGDMRWAKQLQSHIGQLSRQLGLNTSPIDPRLHGAAAEARRRADEILERADDGDGLLAMPGSPARPN
jgi:hypothetical protein